jgi:hypothetical protein
MRIAAACALALTIGGCASNPPPATDQERSDVVAELDACLHAAARKLDDGRSEASTVALGLRPLCAAEFVRSRDVFGRHLNPAARRMYDQKEEAAFVQIATAVVLEERARGRH